MTRVEQNHSSVGLPPNRVVGIGKIDLRFHDDNVPVRWRVDLERLDFRRKRNDT